MHQSRTSCGDSAWTEPQPVGKSSAHATPVARWASIAVGRSGTYVVGVDIPTFDRRLVAVGPLSAWRVGGENLGKPAGGFAFAYPKATVDAAGRLNVLWAEPAKGTNRVPAIEWPPEPLTELWSATYDPLSSRWSTPALVVRARTIRWENARVSRSMTGAPAMAAPMQSESLPFRTALLVTLEDSVWRATNVALETAVVVYTSVAAVKDQLLLAYIAPVRTAENDRNSVFVQRSRDGGKTWTDKRLLSRSGVTPAYDVEALVDPLGHLHVVWRQTMPNGGAALRHVQSTDSGRTWSVADDLEVGQFDHPRTIIDRCGTLHVVFATHTADGSVGRLHHARWAGRWSPAQQIFTRYSVTSHDLQRTSDGEPLLVFLSWPLRAPRDRQPETMVSAFR